MSDPMIAARPDASEAPATCDVAAFQTEAVHEDVAAGYFRVFSDLGLTTNIHFNAKIRDSRGDFFATVSHPRVHSGYVPLDGRPAWHALADKVREESPKFLFFNTFQRDGVARWANQFDLPILGVVHNPFLFRKSDDCMALARAGKLEIFCLAPHVVDATLREIPELAGHVHLHHATDWMRDEDDLYRPPSEADVLRIAVPGAVNYEGRAFGELIEHLATADLSHQRPFRIQIVSGGPDRKRMEQEVAERGLSDLFDFTPLDPVTRRVPHEVMLRKLYACDAVLLLLPVGRKDFLTTKISTGVTAAIGCGRPVIAPPHVANTYGFASIPTGPARPFDVAGARMDDDTLVRHRLAMLDLRRRNFEENQRIISGVLDRMEILNT